ncbi:hypothetical protein [Neotabrizicola sp. VNH66]|uniref:hypothetical protein n=1 Tax=Neotabrizicola sp. VNH66 TaxID=3400918 RepID=UPI003BFB9048
MDMPERIWIDKGPGATWQRTPCFKNMTEYRRADLPPTLEQALALPEIAALVEVAKERDGGGHDEDCRIHRKYREPVHCNCGHDALQAALTAIAQEKQG